MLEDRRDKCHAIIHGAAVTTAGIGAGLAQIPLADSIPITAAQVGMIIAIAHIYDIDLAEGTAKALLGGFSTSVVGRNVAGVLIGWIPGIGNAVKASTAAALTEAIGWAAVRHFENLEAEKRASFNYGTYAGEAKAEEKFKEVLEKIMNRDYFLFSLYRLLSYVKEKEEVKPNGKSDKSQFYGSKTPRAILVTKIGKGDCHKGICSDNKDEHCHQVAPIGIPQKRTNRR